MKRIYAVILTMLTGGIAYALPLGNPADASLLTEGVFFCDNVDYCDPCGSWWDSWGFRIGFYGDYVFNRHLEVENANDDTISDTELFTNAGYVAVNFCDRFDIFATFGATNFYLETNAITFAIPPSTFALVNGDRFYIQSETDFSCSLGARLSVFECGCFTLGLEGQYFYTKPDVTRIGTASDTVYTDNYLEMKYQEWQIGAGLSYQIWKLVPYIGVKFSQAKVDFGNSIVVVNPGTAPNITVRLADLENDLDWGYAIGVTLVDCERASLTVEGRWPDEKAVYVNGQIRF